MIQIKFVTHDKINTKIRKFELCNHKEKNLGSLYEMTKENIQRLGKISFEQFMVVCGFHVVKESRMNHTKETIQKKLVEEWSKSQTITNFLKGLGDITMEVMVDNIPKKIINVSSKD